MVCQEQYNVEEGGVMKPTRVTVRLPRPDEAGHDLEVAEDKARRHLREVGILAEPLVAEFRIAIDDKQRSSACN